MALLLCLLLAINHFNFEDIFSLIKRTVVPHLQLEYGADPLPIRPGCWAVDEANNLYFARLTLRMIDQNDSVHILHPYLAAWTGISAIAVKGVKDVYAFNRFDHQFVKIISPQKILTLLEISEIQDVFSLVYNPIGQCFYATGEWYDATKDFQAFFLIKLKFETKSYEKILFISDAGQYLFLSADIDVSGNLYVISESNRIWKYSPNGVLLQSQNLISQENPQPNPSAVSIIMGHYLLILYYVESSTKPFKFFNLYDARNLKLLASISVPSNFIFDSTNHGRLVYFENRDRALSKKLCDKCSGIIDIYSVNERLIKSLK